jgi:hypothetical protein
MAHDLFRQNVNNNLHVHSRETLQNPFIQNWPVSAAGLPESLRCMFNTAKSAGTVLDGLEIALNIKLSLPIWYHPAITDKPLWNTRWMKCMKR